MGRKGQCDAASVGLTSVLCQLWKTEVTIALGTRTICTTAPGIHSQFIGTEQLNFLCATRKKHDEGGGLNPSTSRALLKENAELFRL